MQQFERPTETLFENAPDSKPGAETQTEQAEALVETLGRSSELGEKFGAIEQMRQTASTHAASADQPVGECAHIVEASVDPFCASIEDSTKALTFRHD